LLAVGRPPSCSVLRAAFTVSSNASAPRVTIAPSTSCQPIPFLIKKSFRASVIPLLFTLFQKHFLRPALENTARPLQGCGRPDTCAAIFAPLPKTLMVTLETFLAAAVLVDRRPFRPPLQVNVSGAIWQSNDLGDAGLLSGISVHRHTPEPISLGAAARLP
jgi:hypothetical protein